jgi:hypothetical protein
MYIEFRLPRGSGGQAAAHVNRLIHTDLQSWQDQHGIVLRSKNIKYTIRVTFDQDLHYTLFAATWNPKKSRFFQDYFNFRIISDLNNRQDTRDLV